MTLYTHIHYYYYMLLSLLRFERINLFIIYLNYVLYINIRLIKIKKKVKLGFYFLSQATEVRLVQSDPVNSKLVIDFENLLDVIL